MKIVHVILLLTLACGCTQEKPSRHVQVCTNVVEGVGIPGSLEIGMRLDSIAEKFPGATCEPSSHASLLWWLGEKWRKHPPWARPAIYELTVPSVGATVFERNPHDQIQQIHFSAKKQYDWPYFNGTLSSGLSFSGTGTVSLAYVVAKYGTPLHTRTHPSITNETTISNAMQQVRQQEAILASGESLLMTSDSGCPYRLHYPARGIYFDIHDGEVSSFRIFKKVEQGAAPLLSAPTGPSEGAR